LGKASIQRELDKFFQALGQMQKITAGALTHARQKLRPEVFIALNDTLVQNFYTYNSSLVRNGIQRILAVDGSRIELPETEKIVLEFGRANKQPDAKPQALASALFDVVNKVAIDFSLNPCCASENHVAVKHLKQISRGDLLIFDRGYKSLWLMLAIVQTGADFLIRLPSNAFKEVEYFLKSDLREKIVMLQPGVKARKQCLNLGIEAKPLKVRLIKVILDSGETEVLITSLLDELLYPYSLFKELYHLRWGIEEGYKTLKCTLEVESFTGKTPHAIYQEFYASLFLSNLQAIITREKDVQDEINLKAKKRKYDYQENRTSALYYVKEKIVSLFTENAIEPIIKFIKNKIVQNILPIRPGRQYNRNRSNYRLPKYRSNLRAIA
jgi:Transposase DDE domain